MTSRGVLIVHTCAFTLFVLASLSSPFLVLWYPELFSGTTLFIIGAFALLMVGSWPVLGGCPFTIWENNLRERKKSGSAYTDACIDHYVLHWFGIKLPNKFSDVLLYALLALPIASGLLL